MVKIGNGEVWLIGLKKTYKGIPRVPSLPSPQLMEYPERVCFSVIGTNGPLGIYVNGYVDSSFVLSQSKLKLNLGQVILQVRGSEGKMNYSITIYTNANLSSSSKPRGAEIEMMQGDWMCLKCNGHNFARRYMCFTCGSSKDGTQGGHGRSSGPKRMEGDWKCSQCQAHNFARREQCFTCGAQKSNDSPQMLKGDWVCSKCKEHNFARRKFCFGCSTARFSSDRPVHQDGDWVCQKCHQLNFARRVLCFGCETRKENAIHSGGAQFYRGPPMYSSGHNSTQHPPPQQGAITQGAHQGSPQVPQRQVGGSSPQGASDLERDTDRQEDRRSRDRQSGGDDDGPHGGQDRSGSNNEPDDDDEDGGDDRLSGEGKGDGSISADVTGSGPYDKHTPPGTGHLDKGSNHPDKSGIYQNDWRCSKCNEINFARRTYCYGCQRAKDPLPSNSTDHSTSGKHAEQLSGGKPTEESESVRSFQSPPHFLSGDWVCNECKEHNFARRYICFNCSSPKNQSHVTSTQRRPPPQNMQPDDWICHSCNGHNFAWRHVCFACSAPRKPDIGISGNAGMGAGLGGGVKKGDWVCPKCQAHNFARRKKCFKCDVNKE